MNGFKRIYRHVKSIFNPPKPKFTRYTTFNGIQINIINNPLYDK